MGHRRTIFAFVLCCGCMELPEHLETVEPTVEKSFFETNEGDAVRIALADISGEMPEASYENLLEQNAIVEQGQLSGTQSVPASLRKLLLTTVGYRSDRIADAQIDVQRFKFNQDFVPLKLFSRTVSTVLPFRLNAGAEIEFARVRDPYGGREARRFTIMDMPHDAISALSLPEGTVVTIPVEVNASFDVGGHFLQRSAHESADLLNKLKVSAVGSTSAVRQGTLLARGKFRIQLVRLSGQRVRLRMLSSAENQIGASLSGLAGIHAGYTFLPAAGLDRVRAFKRRIDGVGRTFQEFRQGTERIEELREQMPDVIQGIVDSVPIADHRVRETVRERASRLTDAALERALQISEPVEALDAALGEKVESVLENISSAWDNRIQPTVDRLNRLSSRVYALSQSVKLSDALARELRLLVDYEFDLSDDASRIAFDRALSARSVWRGMTQALTDWDFESLTFVDFTLAESLAETDNGQAYPRVKRLASGGADIRERDFGVELNALGIQAGLDGHFENNRVTIRDDRGITTEWLNRAWERGQRTRIFGNARSEEFASGIFTQQVGDDSSHGAYWFRWKKTYGDHASSPIAEALTHVLNDLGPMAAELGIPQIYQGEYPGKVSAELLVVIEGKAMERIFDPEDTDNDFVWGVLEEMMSRYIRPHSLPYAHAPIRPAATRENDAIRDGCEAMAERIGGRYCYSFLDRIFPALRAAQDSGELQDRLDFFESFYRVPAGGAVLSTRLLVRYLAELLYALDEEDGINIKVIMTNESDDSEAASPHFTLGRPEIFALSQSTLIEGILE